MELYVPQSIVHGATPLARALAQPVIVYERRLPGTRPHERAKAL
jgi:hypothetical protein